LTFALGRGIVLSMKGRRRILAFPAVAALALLASQDPPPAQDTQPIRPPDTSYMSQWLNRNTRPLGLQEDSRYARLAEQPRIIWAIRASGRHVLD